MTAPRSEQRESTWRASPSDLGRLLTGLWLFGAGVALIVLARLGADPWTVLAEGVAQRTPLTLGGTIIAIGIAVLLLWIPLRERPGLGTVANVVLIGIAVDATLAILPSPGSAGTRIGSLLAGIALIGLGSGLYLGARLGPGPRDGLMTGLHRVTGRPVWQVRAALEGAVLATGWALGGTVGIGTVAFALLIGPSVGAGMRLTGAAPRRPHTSLDLLDGWDTDDTGRQEPPRERLVRDPRGRH